MNDLPCQDLWKQAKVTNRLLYVVFDEGHCVSQWGSTFRSQYLYVGNIRYLLPSHIPFFVTSATLPPNILEDVSEILRLRSNDRLAYFHDSNDRPNIHLVVRGLNYPIHSYKDLAFLIPPDFKAGDSTLPKFLIFFDNTTACEDAVHFLRTRLPSECRSRIRYFHATMTTHYREETFDEFRAGEIWGMAVTDAFGMGLDLPDVQIVVQYRMPADMCTLWQRFGRAGRDFSLEAIAVLLVENSHFDTERVQVINRKRQAAAQASERAAKRARPNHAAESLAQSLGLDCSLATRIARYSKRLMHAAPGARNSKKEVELGTPLDDMVNAATRGFNCYREPILLYF
ncbi:P-loop containing nucleoside triphosphate hydrolase protein, partial [Lentinula raphanica]